MNLVLEFELLVTGRSADCVCLALRRAFKVMDLYHLEAGYPSNQGLDGVLQEAKKAQ